VLKNIQNVIKIFWKMWKMDDKKKKPNIQFVKEENVVNSIKVV